MTLERDLGYTFSDPDLLALALTHRSVSSEDNTTADNERLEFLGDAVLQLAVTDYLYAQFPKLAEGKLAKDGRRPEYLTEGSGPDHEPSFVARVEVEGVLLGMGSGRSKKESEQAAAQQALETLKASSI